MERFNGIAQWHRFFCAWAGGGLFVIITVCSPLLCQQVVDGIRYAYFGGGGGGFRLTESKHAHHTTCCVQNGCACLKEAAFTRRCVQTNR